MKTLLLATLLSLMACNETVDPFATIEESKCMPNASIQLGGETLDPPSFNVLLSAEGTATVKIMVTENGFASLWVSSEDTAAKATLLRSCESGLIHEFLHAGSGVNVNHQFLEGPGVYYLKYSGQPGLRPDASMDFGFTPQRSPFDEMIALYEFNRGAEDGSGNEQHGVIRGGAYVRDGRLVIPSVEQAARIHLPSGQINEKQAVSVVCLVRSTDRTGKGTRYQSLLSCADEDVHNCVLLRYVPVRDDQLVRKWELTMKTPSGSTKRIFSVEDARIEDEMWHSVALTIEYSHGSGVAVRLYFDGAIIADKLLSPDVVAPLSAGPGGWVVGNDQDALNGGYQERDTWGGEIDRLQVFDRALSPDEVRAIAMADRMAAP